jgi:hypothetical protein
MSKIPEKENGWFIEYNLCCGSSVGLLCEKHTQSIKIDIPENSSLDLVRNEATKKWKRVKKSYSPPLKQTKLPPTPSCVPGNPRLIFRLPLNFEDS